MTLRERLLVQVAEGVRVNVSITRASSARPVSAAKQRASVPVWYTDWLRDQRRAGVGPSFSNSGFTLDNVPDVQLGDSRVETPRERVARIMTQRRLAAERREAERQEADEPGAFDDDDWGASMDAPSIEGPLQPERHLQVERLDMADMALPMGKARRPGAVLRYQRMRAAAAPRAKTDDDTAWRFDE